MGRLIGENENMGILHVEYVGTTLPNVDHCAEDAQRGRGDCWNCNTSCGRRGEIQFRTYRSNKINERITYGGMLHLNRVRYSSCPTNPAKGVEVPRNDDGATQTTGSDSKIGGWTTGGVLQNQHISQGTQGIG